MDQQEWGTVRSAAPLHLLAPILLCGVLGWREGEALTRPRTDYKEKKRVSAESGEVVKTPVPRLISAALDALLPHEAATLLSTRRASGGHRVAFRHPCLRSWGGWRKPARWATG
jgi:hypothetical protein